MDAAIEDLADRFFAAVEAGDIDAVRSMYADDAEIWHNFDQAVQTRDQNVAVLAWLAEHMKDKRYTQVRRHGIEGGWAQQHVLVGTAPDGSPLEIPAALFITVQDGRITRLEEYLDSAQAQALFRR